MVSQKQNDHLYLGKTAFILKNALFIVMCEFKDFSFLIKFGCFPRVRMDSLKAYMVQI